MTSARHRAWSLAAAASVLLFLTIVGSYYDRQTGLTVFLALPANAHEYEIPAVQAVPHAHDEVHGGYDGQFYAQFAVDPLLRDPAIDRAMDNPAYRAHRILLSWTAWALSGGQAARAIKIFAWQNIVAWLLMAWVLTRWCAPTSARGFVLWAGVLWSHGWLFSVRNALTDGPSVLLIALAVLAAERNRPWVAACITGVSGLARETNVLAGALLLQRIDRRPRSWLLVAAGLLLCLLPLAIWLDYLRSIYRDAAFVGGDHLTVPLSGFARKVALTAGGLWSSGPTAATVASATVLAGMVAQAVALVWCSWRWWRDRTASPSWLLVAGPFLLLGVVAHPVVWEGSPGAITRVTLPLTVGVNALLAASPRAPWALILTANLGVIAGVLAFALGWV